jgi:putative membrane protein
MLSVLTIWSACKPVNPIVWYFEAFPALALMGAIWWSRRHWPMTSLSNILIAVGAALMLIGAHYTYARMPLFSLLRDSLALSRNHFDRFGHFFQGAVPAIVLREVLIRRHLVTPSAWLSVKVVGLCVVLSVGWEIVEWVAVVIAGGTPEVYQSFQGDPWDSEWDVAWALIGALACLALFSRLHDRQIASLPARMDL